MTGHPGQENHTTRRRRDISRRSFIKAGLAMGAAGGLGALSSRHARLIDAALASDQSTTGSLSDIEHVVILVQENRSFDHYFGTLSDVRGYGDPDVVMQRVSGVRTPVFDQYGPSGYDLAGDPFLQPFELVNNFPSQPGQTTNDITHDWGPQHVSWNNGAMDNFLQVHLETDGSDIGFLTMGYFTRSDLPFYHSLADAFTICDGYHCSVLGPTYPNRLMQMTGSLGADGTGGSPVLETYTDPVPYYGSLDWPTYPEALTAGGVSWKVYQDPTSLVLFNILPFFKNFTSPSSSTDVQNTAQALTPQYPAEFIADVVAGTLPQVSWIIPPVACCEHPAAPPAYGEWLVSEILSTLVSNPDVWASTVFLVIYDENGGFFDHVSPVTPGPMALSPSEIPTGDEYVGEYVTTTLPSDGTYGFNGQTLNIYGPLGLGFRTPALVISPFSRGGYVCSETFDHISVLKFIEARFGVPIPNVSGWRLGAVGDMTSALALSQPPSTGVPSLPPTSLVDPDVAAEAVIDALTGTEDEALIPYPAPTSNQGIPAQETSPARIRIPFLSPVVSGTPGPVHKSGVPERSGTLLAASNGARSSAQGANRSTSVAPGSTNGSSPVTRPIGPMGPRVRHALGATHPGGGDDTGLLAGVSAAGAGALASAALFVRRLVRPAGATSAGSASGPTKPEPGTGDGPTGG